MKTSFLLAPLVALSAFGAANAGVMCGDNKLDILWLLDESGSVQTAGYAQLKTFLQDFADEFTISSTATRMGAVEFAARIGGSIDFLSTSTAPQWKSAVNSLQLRAGRTNQYTAFSWAQTNSGSFPDRSSDPDRNRVIILASDGQPTCPCDHTCYYHTAGQPCHLTAASAAKTALLTRSGDVFVNLRIGAANDFFTSVADIDVIATDYSDLQNIVGELTNAVCVTNAPTSSPVTSSPTFLPTEAAPEGYDPTCIGDTVALSNNDFTATANHQDQWRNAFSVVGYTQGLVNWQLTIDNLENKGNLQIGVVKYNNDCVAKNWNAGNRDFVWTYHGSGNIRHAGTMTAYPTGGSPQFMAEGDVINVVLDFNGTPTPTLEFYHNGTPLGSFNIDGMSGYRLVVGMKKGTQVSMATISP